jgi:disulfide bond formation protein DsbB
MSPEFARGLNVLGLFGVSAVLIVAFADQFVFGDLPCPLCLLQRAGFTAAGVGIVLNIAFGPRPSHYAMIMLGAIAGAAASVRQVLLHIVPGTGSYGAAIAGMHFYSWAAIAFLCMVLAATAMLFFERQFDRRDDPVGRPAGAAFAALALFSAVTLLNAGSTLAECGLGMCPDDPVAYQFLPRLLQPAVPR